MIWPPASPPNMPNSCWRETASKRALIQELGSPHIIIDCLVLDLEPDDRRIVIGAAMIRHGHDIGLEIGLRHQQRTMQVVGESRRSRSGAGR